MLFAIELPQIFLHTPDIFQVFIIKEEMKKDENNIINFPRKELISFFFSHCPSHFYSDPTVIFYMCIFLPTPPPHLKATFTILINQVNKKHGQKNANQPLNKR